MYYIKDNTIYTTLGNIKVGQQHATYQSAVAELQELNNA